MIEAAEPMARSGGAQQVLSLCRGAGQSGYNGLLLWDRNLWERTLPPAYEANAAALKAGLRQLDFALVIEMCPQGIALARWTGNDSLLEPRPPHPHPDEKNYRYLCLSHPGVLPIWEEQVRRAEGLYQPTGWLLQYDEIRVAALDERCRASGKSPGQLLADHARAAVAMCRRVSPGAVVGVWNDMFDPYHNGAKRPYYHVAQGFAGSAAGLDAEVLVVNFNDDARSFDYWSQRGNRQIIAGYFDGELGLEKEKALLQEAHQLPGVIGWMYTTWKENYASLRSYGALCGFGGRSGGL